MFLPTSSFIDFGDFCEHPRLLHLPRLLFWPKFASLPVYSVLRFYLKLENNKINSRGCILLISPSLQGRLKEESKSIPSEGNWKISLQKKKKKKRSLRTAWVKKAKKQTKTIIRNRSQIAQNRMNFYAFLFCYVLIQKRYPVNTWKVFVNTRIKKLCHNSKF